MIGEVSYVGTFQSPGLAIPQPPPVTIGFKNPMVKQDLATDFYFNPSPEVMSNKDFTLSTDNTSEDPLSEDTISLKSVALRDSQNINKTIPRIITTSSVEVPTLRVISLYKEEPTVEEREEWKVPGTENQIKTDPSIDVDNLEDQAILELLDKYFKLEGYEETRRLFDEERKIRTSVTPVKIPKFDAQ